MGPKGVHQEPVLGMEAGLWLSQGAQLLARWVDRGCDLQGLMHTSTITRSGTVANGWCACRVFYGT